VVSGLEVPSGPIDYIFDERKVTGCRKKKVDMQDFASLHHSTILPLTTHHSPLHPKGPQITQRGKPQPKRAGLALKLQITKYKLQTNYKLQITKKTQSAHGV